MTEKHQGRFGRVLRLCSTHGRALSTLLTIAAVAIGVVAAHATASPAVNAHGCVVTAAKPSLARSPRGGETLVAFAAISCDQKISRGSFTVTLQHYCTAHSGRCGRGSPGCSGSGKTASQTIVSGPQNNYDFATVTPASCDASAASFYAIDDSTNQVLACHETTVGPPPGRPACVSSQNPHDYFGPVPGDPHSTVEPSSPYRPPGSSVWHIPVQTNSPYCGSSASDSGPCSSASVHIEYIWSGRALSFVPYWSAVIGHVIAFSKRSRFPAHHKLKVSALPSGFPVCHGKTPSQWRIVTTLHLPGQPKSVTMGAPNTLGCYPG
jgi:hypothetical protein